MAAVLVAIAIPVFTSQLEKSREATDLANIRAAYAEVMVDAIEDNSAASKTIDLKQIEAGWKTEDAENTLDTVFGSGHRTGAPVKGASQANTNFRLLQQELWKRFFVLARRRPAGLLDASQGASTQPGRKSAAQNCWVNLRLV